MNQCLRAACLEDCDYLEWLCSSNTKTYDGNWASTDQYIAKCALRSLYDAEWALRGHRRGP